MSKRVWVVGAGASAADTGGAAPLDANFFEKVLDHISTEKEHFGLLAEILDNIYNYDLWNKRCSPPGLEELFTFLETSLRWINVIKKEQNTEPQRIKKPLVPKDCVGNFYAPILVMHECPYSFFGDIFSIELKNKLEIAYKLLKYAMVMVFYKISQSETPYHDRLFKNIKSGDTIITTNYDLLLDKCLTKNDLFNPINGYFQIFFNEYVHYDSLMRAGKGKDEEAKKRYKDEKWEKDKSKVILLKLHGSINWVNAPSTSSLNVDHFMRLNDNQIEDYLNFPKSQEIAFTPLVIDKQACFNPASKFGRVWAKAFEELSSAEEIVFLGYSFPPTDFLAAHLFKLAETKRKREKTSNIRILFSTKDKKQCENKNDSLKLETTLKNIYTRSKIINLGDFSEAVEHNY